MKNTFVSVIIPTFNRENYLADAIASVLAQTVPPDDVIVVDDGSTDGSAEIVRQFPTVRYCWQANQGAAAARNCGVELAQGNFLAFLDSDDRWLPDKLERQLAAFEAPDLDMVFGHVQQFHSPELDDSTRQRLRILTEVMPGYHVGTMLIRRSSFRRVGPFETQWRTAEFISWHSRATHLGLRAQMLPDVVMQRRLHGGNMGVLQQDNRREYVRVLKTALDRRRANEA